MRLPEQYNIELISNVITMIAGTPGETLNIDQNLVSFDIGF